MVFPHWANIPTNYLDAIERIKIKGEWENPTFIECSMEVKYLQKGVGKTQRRGFASICMLYLYAPERQLFICRCSLNWENPIPGIFDV